MLAKGEADQSTGASLTLVFITSGLYGCIFYPYFRWPDWARIDGPRWKLPWVSSLMQGKLQLPVLSLLTWAVRVTVMLPSQLCVD
jgi:hypothetical protein